MYNERSLVQKIRFFLFVAGLYIGTIGGGWYVLNPTTPSVSSDTTAAASVRPTPPTKQPSTPPAFDLVAGKPIRVVIPDSGIDLPVDEGYYNESDGSWTLSSAHAQYAMMSTLANNASGNTFIYGHGTDEVFGKLGANAPAPGAGALIYTDNGRVLSYRFESVRNLLPGDTSVLSAHNGSSILTIQTCTGSFSEWRSMYQFNFDKVVT